MALKWRLFSKKLQELSAAEGIAPGPHSDKLLSCMQSSKPTAFKIVIARFLDKQML